MGDSHVPIVAGQRGAASARTHDEGRVCHDHREQGLTGAEAAARDGNLVGGHVGGGGSYALDQLVFRPVPALSPYRTPVSGLFLGSTATFPGGAVHGVCGHAAARQALLEARLPRLPMPRR